MKPLLRALLWREALGFRALTTATLLLLVPTGRSQTYTATGSMDQVLAPPIVCTNALGQVLLRAGAFTLRVDSSNPRLTGRRTVFTDGYVQADGSTVIYGTAYQEVGTWAGASFTPNGGIWKLTWRGVMQADCSLRHQETGYGSGGTIDGLRLEETTTRTNASGPYDPATAFLMTGTIKWQPLPVAQTVDRFNDGKTTFWEWETNEFVLPLIETNGRLTLRATISPEIVSRSIGDGWCWAVLRLDYSGWRVENNRTLECRMDLVRMREDAPNGAGFVLWSSDLFSSYIFYKSADYVEIGKWVGPGIALFFHEQKAIKNTNVVLSLSLTRQGRNVGLTPRVLDKDNQEAVLYQGPTIMDTPQVDRTVTSEELAEKSGMYLIVQTDNGIPVTSGNAVFLCIGQYTPDGNLPQMEVTVDNLELRTSSVPSVGIEQAVRLSWPSSATARHAPEWAPALDGPWQPLPDRAIPWISEITVPITEQARFFRLVPAAP